MFDQQPQQPLDYPEQHKDDESEPPMQQDTAEESDDTGTAVVEHPSEWDPAAVSIQAAWRGYSARKAYEEERVTRQWAAVKVQSFFRVRRARRLFNKQMRYAWGATTHKRHDRPVFIG